MPGPAPKPDAIRRNKTVTQTLPMVTTLPAPDWPLAEPLKHFPKDATDQQIADIELEHMQARELELEIWRDLWRTPQATLWHRQNNRRAVARYARLLADAELGDLKAASECRLMEDRLLLNPKAMAAARVAVAADELTAARDLKAVGEAADEAPTSAARKTSSRKKRALTVVNDGSKARKKTG